MDEQGHRIHDEHGYGDQKHETVVFMEHCRLPDFRRFAGYLQFLFRTF